MASSHLGGEPASPPCQPLARERRPPYGAIRFEPIMVHQAGGVISAQLDVPVSDALLRLRAYAFRTDRPITAIAHDIVARRLRFDDSDNEESPNT